MLDDETQELYLKTIAELVSDEEKTITYSFLANNLSVSINVAKYLLESYSKQSEESLNVLHFVSAVPKGETGVVMDILDRSRLQDWKKEMSHILSDHIYSISLHGKPSDLNALVLTENFDDYRTQLSIIKSDKIGMRSDDELQRIREVTYKLNNQSVPIKKETVNINKSPSKPSAEKKNSISSMLNAPAKPKIENGNQNVNKPNQNKKGIQGFFQKQASQPPPEKKNVKQETIILKIAEPKKTVPLSEPKRSPEPKKTVPLPEPKKIVPLSEPKKTVPPAKVTPKNERKPKKKTETKKRKRVICMSDSDDDDVADKPNDSDDPFGDDHSAKENISSDDEVIPPTPIAEPAKIAPANPRKRKKVIDKTYTDEEGYILTKKEVIFESCSEEEENAESKKIEEVKPPVKVAKVETKEKSPGKKPKAAKSKKAPPTLKTGKQASLTNFFKKI